MITNLLRGVIDGKLHENTHVLIRSLISDISVRNVKEYQIPLTISFIKFSKAFDAFTSPPYGEYSSYGVPEMVVKSIVCIYDSSHCCGKAEDGFNSWF